MTFTGKLILFVGISGLIIGCGEHYEIPIWKDLIGTYQIQVLHFDYRKNKLPLSETGKIEIIRANEPQFLNMLVLNDTVRISNLRQIDNYVLFDINDTLTDYDDYGLQYQLRPCTDILINNNPYAAFFDQRSQSIEIAFQKVYTDGKMMVNSGFAVISGEKF